MLAPFAEYELTEKPEWATVSIRVAERLVLDPRSDHFVSRRTDDFIWVSGDDRLFENGWGGRRFAWGEPPSHSRLAIASSRRVVWCSHSVSAMTSKRWPLS